jgi:hypothetical protein
MIIFSKVASALRVPLEAVKASLDDILDVQLKSFVVVKRYKRL